MHEGYEKARDILNEHQEQLDTLAKALMENGAISGEIMSKLYRGEINSTEVPKSGIELIE